MTSLTISELPCHLYLLSYYSFSPSKLFSWLSHTCPRFHFPAIWNPVIDYLFSATVLYMHNVKDVLSIYPTPGFTGCGTYANTLPSLKV